MFPITNTINYKYYNNPHQRLCWHLHTSQSGDNLFVFGLLTFKFWKKWAVSLSIFHFINCYFWGSPPLLSNILFSLENRQWQPSLGPCCCNTLQHSSALELPTTSICKNTFATNSSKKVHFGDDFYFPLFALLKSCSGLTSVCCSVIHFFMSMDNFKSFADKFSLLENSPLFIVQSNILFILCLYSSALCRAPAQDPHQPEIVKFEF